MLYIANMTLSKISRAFSDDNRIKILKMLGDGARNVSQVADKLDVEENLASHHLRFLASMGFLKNERKGRQVFYRINETRFASLLKDLKKSRIFKEILLKAL